MSGQVEQNSPRGRAGQKVTMTISLDPEARDALSQLAHDRGFIRGEGGNVSGFLNALALGRLPKSEDPGEVSEMIAKQLNAIEVALGRLRTIAVTD